MLLLFLRSKNNNNPSSPFGCASAPLCFFCKGNNKPLLRSLEGATAATAKAFLQDQALCCKGHALDCFPRGAKRYCCAFFAANAFVTLRVR